MPLQGDESTGLSLILATYGRAWELGRFIESLIAQTNLEFELIIVDQNNDVRVAPYVRLAELRGLAVRHIRMSQPGLSAARNAGISVARREILAFPDDDCWYEPDVVEKVTQAIEGDSSLDGIIGCWVEESRQCGGIRPYSLDLRRFRRFQGGQASSITLFLRRAPLVALGGFDERLGLGSWFGSGEDTDILLRTLSSGARMKFNPSVRVHHSITSQVARPFAQKCKTARIRSRGAGAIYSKHRLPGGVILRGFVGPILRALLTLSPPKIVTAFFVTIGRIEGFMRWKHCES